MSRKFLLRALALTTLLISGAATAQTPWYQVEVIVFAYTNPDSHGELWYQNPGLPDLQNSIELITGAADPIAPSGKTRRDKSGKARQPLRIPYRELPSSRYRLDGVERILKLSRNYKPLLHVAWQQPGEESENARAVHLEVSRPAAQAPAKGSANTIAAVSEDLLDGIIRLRVSRFLHVDVDMAYFPPDPSVLAPPQSVSSQTEDRSDRIAPHADYVRMIQTRKIKLNELDYFDHPLFGVLLQVSRLQTDQDQDANQ